MFAEMPVCYSETVKCCNLNYWLHQDVFSSNTQHLTSET